jgi:glycosyltransferase involved in cell wall biosynthesis
MIDEANRQTEQHPRTIVFTHLLNDRSGSPKVLASAIAGLLAGGAKGRLFVGSDGDGCLSDAKLPITKYWYRRTPHRPLTLLTYLFSQAALFIRLAASGTVPRHAVLYVNTLLPFGAALYGMVTGRRVVYHLHEVSVSPAPLRWLLVGIARVTASRLIYVSEFHRKCLPIPSVPAVTVHNALDQGFLELAANSGYHHRRNGVFLVLMLASLRDYKGVPEFLSLAAQFEARSDVAFRLVANEDESAIARYFDQRDRPANVAIFPRTSAPEEHYAAASVVVNLSRPDQWIETFGLTVLEALAFGIPVIAPPVGGPTELISDGQEGFLVDSRDGTTLVQRVRQLLDDPALCMNLSTAARQRATHFAPAAFVHGLRCALDVLATD